MKTDTIEIIITRDLGDKEIRAELTLNPTQLAGQLPFSPGLVCASAIDGAIAEMDKSRPALAQAVDEA